MNSPGRYLIIVGLVVLLVGLIWEFGSRFFPFGRLPGDISIERENFRFYFPIATSILLSVVLSLVFYIFRNFQK